MATVRRAKSIDSDAVPRLPQGLGEREAAHELHQQYGFVHGGRAYGLPLS